jgi:hypothetical protein
MRSAAVADHPSSTLPRLWDLLLAGIGVFHARHDTCLEVLAFLDEPFDALRIWLLGIQQSLRIARLPS